MAFVLQLVDGVCVHSFVLDRPETVFGRKAESDIVVDDTAVSGSHAVIRRVANPDFPAYVEYILEDLKSTNGTKLNEGDVVSPTKLSDGDVITIAWNTFKFIDDMAGTLEKTRQMLP